MLTRRLKRIVVVAVVLVAGMFAWTMLAQANATDDEHAAAIAGAGTSLIRGGTGSPSFTPVMTKFGFNWRNGQGGFECLALAPSVAAGKPGSGNFDTNAMYVTGSLTSAQVRGQSAVLKGTATVTGLGAGTDAPFTATVTRGGPGATLVLEVSGLTFSEIVLEGQIRF
jgi:uncharacterized protein with beta-barrel porin domain